MSKMTREELTRDKAKELLERDLEFIRDRAIEEAYGEPSDIRQAKLFYKQQMEALNILSPSPRTEPPTVDEVGSLSRNVLHWRSLNRSWFIYTLDEVQKRWANDDRWLLIEALPMPKGTP